MYSYYSLKIGSPSIPIRKVSSVGRQAASDRLLVGRFEFLFPHFRHENDQRISVVIVTRARHRSRRSLILDEIPKVLWDILFMDGCEKELQFGWFAGFAK
ncbi:hypothetical protein OPV22_034914 [Ensete ventricosum]|uniref:Uncharacterized protein n=1 Tax=Ensete ventricosum TaxID=4639 RepID=A0AAV8PU26_ENSVE|nr:hypothetical protein OPV22_034914 [Ensete ventricosum]